jgi:hypothetical protein
MSLLLLFRAPAGSDTEPPPGGATAGGRGPVAVVQAPTGGVTAQGPSQTVSVALSPGGATAGGRGPGAVTSTSPGGVQAQGRTPIPTAPLSSGGIAAGGYAPAESQQGGEVVPRGGVTVSGFSPVVFTTVSAGGSSTGGTGPVARVEFSIGGASVSGTAPIAFIGVPPSGTIDHDLAAVAGVDTALVVGSGTESGLQYVGGVE